MTVHMKILYGDEQHSHENSMSSQRNERYIGLNVHYVRKKVLQVSQEEFGYMVGMSKDTVSNIERGVFAPNVHTLVMIANCVNIPVEFFLHENMEDLIKTHMECLS